MRNKTKHRKYQLKWIQNRRSKWFQENGPCKKCGSWENLELDHIDRTIKKSHRVWSWAESKRIEELKNCQVLCETCHKLKSAQECKELFSGTKNLKARKYDSEVVNQVFIDFHHNKIPARKIAKKFNIPRGTVSNWIYDYKKPSYKEIKDLFQVGETSITNGC